MAFTFDASHRMGINAGNPRTTSIPVGASATILIVSLLTSGATLRAGGAPSFNGVTLTQASITQQHSGDAVSLEVWYLLNPAKGGTYTLSIPNTNLASIDGFSVSYNTATGDVIKLDAEVSTNSSGTNPAISVTTVSANELVFGCLYEITTTAPSASTFTSFNYNDTTFEHCNQYGIRSSASTANLSWTNSTASNYGIVAVAFNINVFVGAGGTVEGGTNTIALTSSIGGGEAIGGVNTLKITSSVSNGVTIGGTALNYPSGGLLAGGTSNTLVVCTAKGGYLGGGTALNYPIGGVSVGNVTPVTYGFVSLGGSVESGTNGLKIASTATSGVIVSGTTTPTQVSYNFISSGGIVAGGNYKLNYFPVGGTVINGAALGSYMLGGILLGGNAAVSYNTVFTPSGGTIEGGSNLTTISLLSNGGMAIGVTNPLSLSFLSDSGVVTSNSDPNLTIGSSTTGGMPVSGTGFGFSQIADGGVVCSGSIFSAYVINPEGGITFDSDLAENISIDPTTLTAGLVASGSGVNVEELVVGGFILSGETPVSVSLLTDGGSVSGGHYTTYYETDPDGGLVVETTNGNTLSFSTDGGMLAGGFYSATYIVDGTGGIVLSGNYQYQVTSIGGAVIDGTAFPALIKVTPFGGMLLGGTNTESLISKVSGGLLAGGHYFNASIIEFIATGGAVTEGTSRTALKIPVAGGTVEGGTLPLTVGVTVSGGILISGFTTFVINANEISEGGTVGGGLAPTIINVKATGGCLAGGSSPNTVSVIETEAGGLLAGGTVLLAYAFSATGGLSVSGTIISAITSSVDGGFVLGGDESLQIIIDESTGLVVGGDTDLLLEVTAVGGLIVNHPVLIQTVTFNAQGGLCVSSTSLLESIHYSFTSQGGLVATVTGKHTISSAVSGGLINSDDSILQSIIVTAKASMVLSGINSTSIISSATSGVLSGGTAIDYPIGGLVAGGVGHTEGLDITIGMVFGGTNVQSYQFIAQGGTVVSNDTPIMQGGLVLGGTYTRATVVSGGLLVGGSTSINISSTSTEGVVFGGEYYLNFPYLATGGIVAGNLLQVGMVVGSSTSYKVSITSFNGLVVGGRYLKSARKVTTVIRIQATSLGFRLGRK